MHAAAPGETWRSSDAEVIVRGTVRLSQLPEELSSIASVHAHNIKADGVPSVRDLLKRTRPRLRELQLWYCSLSDHHWGRVFNSLSGVRRTREVDAHAKQQLLATLKREFMPEDAEEHIINARKHANNAEDEESEVSDEEAKRLSAEVLSLRNLELHGCKLSRRSCVHLLSLLRGTAQLERLVMCENGLDEIDAGLLMRALLSCSEQKHITLTENGVGDAAMMMFSQHLIKHAQQLQADPQQPWLETPDNPQLLPLQSVDFSKNCIRRAGAIAVGNMLKAPSRLHTLSLASNFLEDSGGVALASGLLTNGSLQSLDLSDCSIGERGVEAILGSLHRNMLMKNLVLNRNTCESSIEPAVVELLLHNRKLQVLELSQMGRGLLTVQALCDSEALRTNNWLQKLNISCNRLQDSGALQLAKSLTSGWNLSLKDLDIGGNRITDNAAWAFVEAVSLQKHGLEVLGLDQNEFGVDGKDILELLRKLIPTVEYSFMSVADAEIPAHCEGYGGCCGMVSHTMCIHE
eukprot:TRINITY_DN13836_c0_g1_i1.p1 TRINITY_DN13836_c0_g1~~TRINITY_DN13836_c0_g1_i1.p1  ORF type:complete len:519 (+),score=124.81 TRINITY_DN13836_c0_g1_i1:211-1767(+)